MTHCALTIAGSDPTGGSGIQADLKTFAALGVYGLSVVACLTAQNSSGVQSVHPASPAFVRSQFRSLITDFRIDAAKIGMVYKKEIIEEISRLIKAHRVKNLVLDPVVKSSSGGDLIKEGGVDALKTEILPLTTIITPNLEEAEQLTGLDVKGPDAMKEAACRIHQMGPRFVLIKGGHLKGRIQGLFFDGNNYTFISMDRNPNEVRGTGCTLSAAITSGLAKGLPVLESVRKAQEYTQGVIQGALRLGKGPLLPDHCAFSASMSDKIQP